MDTDLRVQLRGFVTRNFLFGDAAAMPADEESLLESGVLDSTGVLELIEHLEETYGITVGDTETVPANLDSIAGLARFVLGKQDAAAVTG